MRSKRLEARWARLTRPLLRASLWRRLALLLLPLLVAATAVELWMTRRHALEAANAAYDRSLLGALKAIDANISTDSGGLAVELPYRLFEFFELTASGQVFFRIATSDGLVELGSADLPAPPAEPAEGKPVFYDADYFGESVRLVAYRRELPQPPAGSTARTVQILVAESTRSRQEFSRGFVRSAAARDAFVLGVLLLGSVYALSLALRPLTRMAREVQARRPDDLTPLADARLPADIRPLVAAVNHQMARIQDLMAQQRGFLDDASHQLRTHLTTLQMQADYAQRAEDPADVRAALGALATEIGRATQTTQQLLALGRSDAATPERAPVDLAELARETAVAFLPRARARRIDLGIDVPDGPCVATGDRGMLQEALRNLLANAIAYTPQEGMVTVSAAAAPPSRGGNRLAVEDDGPGLGAEERALLGQRFRRGKQAAEGGSGLGLAIARSIAERHGGKLELEARGDRTGLRAVLRWPGQEEPP
jgi:two-component system sensor histidine kinase TctE